MRARNIKPGFFNNEELGDCSIPARLLFIGLWCLADCEGKLEDKPRRIQVDVFPYNPGENVEELLQELHNKELIIRYNRNGINLILIPNFKKHQKPHSNEASRGFPDPYNDGYF